MELGDITRPGYARAVELAEYVISIECKRGDCWRTCIRAFGDFANLRSLVVHHLSFGRSFLELLAEFGTPVINWLPL